MAIFDISKKWEPKEIYSFGEVYGGNVDNFLLIINYPLAVTGVGDVTYNSRRNMLGGICLGGGVAYHLWNIDANASRVDDIVKLSRRSRWHWQYNFENRNSQIFSCISITLS